MTDPTAEFTWTGLNPRKAGRFLRVASHVLPGVGRVQAQAVPYAAAWRASNLAALSAEGPLWVALGDSLSQGVGASTFDRGWIGQLARRLQPTPDRAGGTPGTAALGAGTNAGTTAAGGAYRVVNLSMTGARVDDVLDLQLPVLESLGVTPALITLLVGSNDLFRRADRSTLAAHYEQLLRRLPSTTVIVATLPNPSAAARALNRVTYTVAAERGFAVADTRRDSRTQFWAGKLAADRFHPNDRGYAAVAGVFEDAYVAMSTKRE